MLAKVIPWEGYEEESVPGLSPGFWRFAGHLWCSLACGRIIIQDSAFMFTWCFPVCLSMSKFPIYRKYPE